MFRLKLISTTIILLFILTAPCSAKSLLTYFDTVVIECESDISREDVLKSVLIKPDVSTKSFSEYPVESKSGNSNLHEIISTAANSFFQK